MIVPLIAGKLAYLIEMIRADLLPIVKQLNLCPLPVRVPVDQDASLILVDTFQNQDFGPGVAGNDRLHHVGHDMVHLQAVTGEDGAGAGLVDVNDFDLFFVVFASPEVPINDSDSQP